MLNNLISLYNGGAAASTTSYESIATVTVGAGGSSSISFSSIPSTYKHLQIRAMIINTASSGNVYMRLNSDAGSNYNAHYLSGNGGTVSSGVFTSTYFYAAYNSTTNPGIGITDILDYTNTNKYKVTRTLMGNDRNGSGDIALTSGLWLNKNAITQITILPAANLFDQHSSFALYGVKG